MRAFLLSLTLLFNTLPVFAEISVEYELDPYYSNVGLFVPLTEEDIPEVELKNESRIYLNLLKDALTPRFFLLEASINPLPVLGAWLKDEQDSLYQDAQINPDLNLIAALTEGFEEPYALSFFIGNVIRFHLPDEEKPGAINKGYSGLVVSIGDQHIKANSYIDDNWYEIEWKLKGDRRIGPVYHSWSFRVGAKAHDHPEIVDVFYFGIRRELFNRELSHYKFLHNTGIDFRMDFARSNSSLAQKNIYVEKRWPKKQAVYTLGLGIKQAIGKYSGSLSDGNQTRLIIRPGILF